MKNISALLKKAEKAQPPTTSRSSWAPLLPVVQKLIGERRFTLWAAVVWLVEQGEIDPDEKRNAYHSLFGIIDRQKKAKSTP